MATTITRRPGLLRDMFNGAVLGDYAPWLGFTGVVTQIVLGYVPIIGTICAFRDMLADRSSGDYLGTVLNFIALFPVLGGFAKTAEVLEHTRHLAAAHRALRSHGQPPGAAEPLPPAHFSTSLALALLAPVLVTLMGLGAVKWVTPWLQLTSRGTGIMLLIIGFAMPLLIVVMGHIERHQRARVRRSGTLFGLFLGYCYLLVMVMVSSVVLTLR
jgi:hypothetical protein